MTNKTQQRENYVNKETVKTLIKYSTWAAGIYTKRDEQGESARIHRALTHLLI